MRQRLRSWSWSLALVPSLAYAEEVAAPASETPAPTVAAAAGPSAPVAPAPAHVPGATAEPTPSVSVLGLRAMREKGLLTPAEYDAAISEIATTSGIAAEDAPSLVFGRWSATLYGFAELDAIVDTTQSFGDVAGNIQVQRQDGDYPPAPFLPTTYAGDHGRAQMSIRNSRFGFRLRAPESANVRASATLELDFLGASASLDPSVNNRGEVVYPYATGASEASFWNNPALRVRHAFFRVETPVVDITAGQTWHLFGWQPVFHPNTVQIQGVPGELYQRTAQVKLSKRIPLGPTSIELAGAALRPPQRDSMMPELTGGLRFSVDSWTGLQTQGATAKALAPASIAVTGTARNFVLPEFSLLPKKSVALTTGGVAVDAFLPVIPASKGKEGNSLSVLGQFVMGGGIGDMFTSMQSGLTFPTLPNTTGLNPPPTYPQDVENGLVVYDRTNFDLHPIQWNALMVGVQYYLPGLAGKVWLSGNYAHVASPNIAQYTRNETTAPNPNDINYTAAALVRDGQDWFDACLFIDALSSVRFGFEYAHYDDHFADGKHAINHRGVASGFFLF